ncbi:MAG: hypothetical protein GTN89_14595 [Acidobacteria bacterium]|nr:hypothetical protein [Acidobacteriota bacterium]NIM64162.1 hypothetical protein [Acidobacteriota bacterium]NIO60463.1 hypothetical protein [Acidobacteriota bacterium]NIQ31561.1 hypothetical protein [Acidobacteriota bacterium]NIQ86813.1 hypothetical protein [Acidobacteriota bacterium]
MAIIKRIGTIAAAAALCLGLVTPAMAASDITVGEFVQRLAVAKGLAGTDVTVASNSLRGIGVRLPSGLDYGSHLTEGTVAEISRAVGLTVRTSNPENAFTAQQTETFFVSFGDDLAGDGGMRSHTNPGGGSGPGNGESGPPFDPFTKGKHGKGKGKGVFTPTEPE